MEAKLLSLYHWGQWKRFNEKKSILFSPGEF